MRKFVQKLYEVYRPLRWRMLGVMGFMLLAQAMNLVSPYFQSKLIDGLYAKQIAQVYWFAIASFILWIVKGTFFQWLRDRYEITYVDYSIPKRMQEITLSKLFRFSIGQHTSENSGIKQSVISRGENALENMVDILFYQMLPRVLEVLILTGVLFKLDFWMGTIVLSCVVVYVWYVYILNTRFRGDMKKIEKLFIKDSKFQGEVMRNVALVMVNAQEARAQKECIESLGKAFTFAGKVWTRFVFWANIRNAIPIITRFAVLLLGIKYVLSGRYSVGELTMFLSWSANAVGNLGDLSPMHRRLIQAYNSIKRYFDMLSIEPDVKVVDNPVRPDRFSGRIEFKDVTFRYRSRDAKSAIEDDEEAESEEERDGAQKETHPALDSVSFVIEPGQTVAFVGESGAGKSTLVNALIRAQDPEKGQIIVDGNDLRVIDLKHFRESIGFVNQDVSLFDHTLRYNITYGLNGRAERVTDRELHAIADMSCVTRFFDRLEKGFDTIIGERGVKLSGGERQRVGIARALIKEPDILIFDEATSNLDSGNEGMIQESIDRASQGRTTIIIAHRFSTIRNVSKVIVLDKGKMVGQGTHQELHKSCEVYRQLAEKQGFTASSCAAE